MTRKRPRWLVFRIFVTYNFWSDSKNNMIFQRRCTTYLYLGLWKKHNYHVRSCFPSSFSGDWNVRNMKEAFLKHLSCWQPGNCKENFFQLESTKNIKKSTNSNAKQRWHSTRWLVVSLFEPILYFCFCYIKPTIRAFVVTLKTLLERMLIILAHCLVGGLVSVRPIFLSGSIHRDRLTYQYWTDVVEAPTNTHPLLHTINNNQQLSQAHTDWHISVLDWCGTPPRQYPSTITYY